MSTCRTITIVSILAVGLSTAAGARAAQETPKLQNECWPKFAEFDANADKVIDADELGVDKERIFRLLDLDHGGYLTKEEFIECLAVKGDNAAMIPEFFVNLDQNTDGRLTLSEFSIEGKSEWSEMNVLQERRRLGKAKQ